MLPVPQPGHTSYAPQGTAASLWGNVTAAWGSSGTTDVPLPTDKLPSSLPCGTEHPPVLLVNCGSFNPPTIMHLRMFDVAAQVLKKVTMQLAALMHVYWTVTCQLQPSH